MAAARAEICGTPLPRNEWIFCLVDQSWFTQSLWNHHPKTQAECTNANVYLPSLAGDHEPAYCDLPGDYTLGKDGLNTVDESQSLQENSSEESRQQSSSSSAGVGHHHHDKEAIGGTVDESEMRRVFERFDTNANGFISGEDLQRHMTRLGFNMTNDEATSIISSVDRNNDHFVDFDEFLSLYRTYSPDPNGEGMADGGDDDLSEAFCVFDKNRDGFISAEELQAVLLNLGMTEGESLMSCRNMIRNVDDNGDGLCDIKEFKKMMCS